MKPSNEYSNEYEEYASIKAPYYKSAKFNPITHWGYRNHLREDRILSLVESSGATICLDMGCASGHTSLRIARLSKIRYVLGVDIAPSFINQAKKSSQEENLVSAEFQTLVDFTENNATDLFDFVLCAEVIEHVEALEELFESLTKHAKKEAIFLFTTPNLNGDGTLIGRALRKMGVRRFIPATTFSSSSAEKHGDQHVREFDVRKLEAILKLHGFDVRHIEGMFLFDEGVARLWYKIMRRVNVLRFAVESFSSIARKLFPRVYLHLGSQIILTASLQSNEISRVVPNRANL